MNTILITGVSSGIGFELAKIFLKNNFKVFGISRKKPDELTKFKNFQFNCIDLSDVYEIKNILKKIFIDNNPVNGFKYVFLNAGQYSLRIAKMQYVPLKEIEYIMKVNVWSNKIILDFLLNYNFKIDTVIFSASMAGIRARAGYNVYNLSKATLNMLGKLYALENPNIFFAVLGLCIVDTPLFHNVIKLLKPGAFPEIDRLIERTKTKGYIATALQRAQHVYDLLTSGDIREKVNSGDFIDIRTII